MDLTKEGIELEIERLEGEAVALRREADAADRVRDALKLTLDYHARGASREPASAADPKDDDEDAEPWICVGCGVTYPVTVSDCPACGVAEAKTPAGVARDGEPLPPKDPVKAAAGRKGAAASARSRRLDGARGTKRSRDPWNDPSPAGKGSPELRSKNIRRTEDGHFVSVWDGREGLTSVGRQGVNPESRAARAQPRRGSRS